MCVRVVMRGWQKIEALQNTQGMVIKKIIQEAPYESFGRPNEESCCTVMYTVRN